MQMNCFAMPADKEELLRTAKKSTTEIIHSGHFMVSDIDDTDATDEPPRAREDDCVEEVEQSLMEPVDEGNEELEFCNVSTDLDKANKHTTHITIDASLTKLFECMTLAYSGKLTSPKWKTFKGLKLRLKDKIRLNNIIWRAWHMQFATKRKPYVCQFASPLEGDTHNKPEAIVLEGKYWKRKVSNVTAEYKKWRMYFCKKGGYGKSGDTTPSHPMDQDFHWFSQSVPTDDDFMDLSDTLFSSLSQPFDFPNPREIAIRAGLADFIQPGLIQLQPAFDDLMDTLEPLSDMLNSKLPTLTEEGTLTSEVATGSQMQTFQSPPVQRTPLLYERQLSPQEQFQQQQLEQQQQQLQQQMYSPPVQKSQQSMNTSSSGIFTPVVVQQSSLQSVQCPPMSQEQLSPPTENALGSYGFLPNQNALPRFAVQPQVATQIVQHQDSAFSIPSIYSQKAESQSAPQKHTASFGNLVLAGNASIGDQQGVIYQPGLMPGPGLAENEKTTLDPSMRRHSYSASQRDRGYGALSMGKAASQSVYTVGQTSTSHGGQNSFVVPKVASKGRIRGRSMSSPQSSSKLQAVAAAAATSAKQTGSVGHLPGVHSPPQLLPSKQQVPIPQARVTQASSPMSSSVQPNTVLTQLLTSAGNTFSWDAQVTQASAGISRGSSPATVAILSTVAGPATVAQPQTFVISPVTLSAIPSTNNFQRGLIVSTTPSVSPMAAALPSRQSSSNSANAAPRPKATDPQASATASKPFRPKSDEDKVHYREKRRVCHINAEQKRRFNIKNGFDSLRHLLPSLSQNPDSKVSKAQMLQQAGEYIRTLKNERQKQQDEAEELRKQIESYSQAINLFQSQLPATGVPLPCQRTNHMRESFEGYVQTRTLQNWKFWIFSLLLEPLLESYNQTVSTACLDEMCKTILKWVEQNCSLRDLRPGVLTSLTYLSTSTNILSDPSRLPEEAKQAVMKRGSVPRYKFSSGSLKDR